jgi:dynein intermediate chain 2
MIHLEGGWPKDVNMNDIDSKKRYQKKVEKDDNYIKSLKELVNTTNYFMEQNTTIDLYEFYFTNSNEKEKIHNNENKYKISSKNDDPIDSTDKINIEKFNSAQYNTNSSSATILTVLKDPCTDCNRIINGISFQPSDKKKLAAAYYIPHTQPMNQNVNTNSYIWDIRNPNSPDMALSPTSPLSCLEYNQKDTTCIVAGSRNGTVFVFDTRRGSNSVEYSHVHNSHKDPIHSIQWIQSKQFTECVSISSDCQILFWDIRNLVEPYEKHTLEVTQSKQVEAQKFSTICLNYDTSYSVSSNT